MTEEQTNPNEETPVTPEVIDVASLQARIEVLEKEVSDHKDAYLRATADYKNLKRRYDTERIELIGRASAAVLLKLLPVVDDLNRAISSVTAEVAGSLWYGGFKLIPNKLQQLLDSEGITAIATVDSAFDPNLHEAIAYEPSDAAHDGLVVAELQRGYLLRDKVLRPAMVKVGKAE